MKGISLAKFLAVALVIGLLAYVAYKGVTIHNNSLGGKHIRQGLDIKGGVFIQYEPKNVKLDDVTPGQLDSAKQILRKRLDSRGLFDSTVTVDEGNKRLVVEVPGATDARKAVDEIGKTAKLQFRDSDGKVIIEGNDISNAESKQIQDKYGKYQWVVSLSFTPSASKKFADATERVAALSKEGKNFISIYLDETPISSPSVSEKIESDGAQIEGGDFTSKTTKELADTIRSGALPFGLESVQVDEIGPTLGKQALDLSVMAGAIAFGLICIFMLLWYRLPGLVANIALVAYVALIVLILSGAKIALTLPGIAGIILSVGMAVDANIIIFERVKEELRAGKTLRGAVEIGFKRAFTTIFDANITTIIVGIVLFIFGTGPIKGFAVTLILGVVLSFFAAITLTRYLLLLVMGLGLRKPWLYGYKGGAINA